MKTPIVNIEPITLRNRAEEARAFQHMVLDGKHDHDRHNWDGRCQHRLGDDGGAVAEREQANQDQRRLNDVLQQRQR